MPHSFPSPARTPAAVHQRYGCHPAPYQSDSNGAGHAVTGAGADATNPADWASYEDALAAYKRGGWDGIGFAVCRGAGARSTTGEGGGADPAGTDIVVFDLDKCLDAVTGVMEDWAADVVKALDTYTERSPSGRGLRLVALGRKPGPKCRKDRFERYEDKRYVTITGWVVDGPPPTVESRQPAIASLDDKYLEGLAPRPGRRQPPPQAEAQAEEPSLDADDRLLLTDARAAANGAKFALRGEGRWDEGAHASQSEADLALCSILAFWAGPDPDRIDRLFRASGLMRDKWDRPSGDQTYGERTIARALQGPADVTPDALMTARSRPRAPVIPPLSRPNDAAPLR